MEKKQINRRSFFSKSIQGMGAIAAMNTINPRYPAPTILTSTGKKGNIIYRTLGKTGLKMPIIGMGVMNANIPEIVAESYKQGVRHFDTAWFYQRGRNEEMVGDVIKTLGVRDDVTIATKIYIRDVSQGKTGEELKDIFLDRFHQSLKRLKTDYVDILYLHNVEYLAQIKVPEIKTDLTKLKKEKKVRFVGFSTHANMTEVISEAIKSDLWEVILVAYNFTMWDDQNLYKTLQQAFNKGIGLVGMKTQT